MVIVDGSLNIVDDELQHAGVKGMKWGSRKATSNSSGPSRNERIKTARSELQGKLIKAERDNVLYNKAIGTKGEAKAHKVLQKSGQDYYDTLNTAMMKTGGERVAIALAIIGPLAIVGALNLAGK